MEDKIADERYFILTLFAIAKELSYREKNEGLLSQNLQEIELTVLCFHVFVTGIH